VTVDVRSRAEAGLSSPSPFSYLTGATEETDAAWIYRNKKRAGAEQRSIGLVCRPTKDALHVAFL
jgi:hypothetical protein